MTLQLSLDKSHLDVDPSVGEALWRQLQLARLEKNHPCGVAGCEYAFYSTIGLTKHRAKGKHGPIQKERRLQGLRKRKKEPQHALSNKKAKGQ